MPPKLATYIAYGLDEHGEDVRKYIINAGVRLTVRDTKKDPLNYAELDGLLGHIPMINFLNKASQEYAKLDLGEELPDRHEMLDILAKNPGLLRGPIVRTSRLLTVGCDKEKISKMLHINRNGVLEEEQLNNRQPRSNRRSQPAGK